MTFQGRWIFWIALIGLAGPVRAATYFPVNGASNVNSDTPLRITFQGPPTLSGKGKIQIFDTATNAPVESIDTSTRIAKKTIGGMTNFSYYPVIIRGNDATIYPKSGSLTYGKEYRVTIDEGAFADEKEMSLTFKTKATPPAAGTKRLTVAADGTGDFSTVQGALDSLPDGNTTPTTIFIRKGTYEEIVFITNKHAITLLGEDRKQTIIQYANNERFNLISGNPFGDQKPDPVSFDIVNGPVYHRGMLIAHRCNDLTIANLTLHNTTPKGGSQAEAILLVGTTTAHAVLKDVDLLSFQDTLQINGQAYLNNCYIEGDVDFMWGTGPVVFENCTCKSLQSRTYFTQIRNQPTNHGFVYIRCTLEGGPDVSAFLSRVDGNKYTHSEVVFMDCAMTDAVSPAAWAPLQGNSPDVHYWEFNSHGPDGKSVDVSKRATNSRQLKQPDDAELIKNYSDPSFILGGAWNPKSAAIFTSTR